MQSTAPLSSGSALSKCSPGRPALNLSGLSAAAASDTKAQGEEASTRCRCCCVFGPRRRLWSRLWSGEPETTST
eukprot:4553278-Prymnesium_polylepis.1